MEALSLQMFVAYVSKFQRPGTTGLPEAAKTRSTGFCRR